MTNLSKIAVIGGSGLYQIENSSTVRQIAIDTPFGSPSGTITSCCIDGCELLFLPRHGTNHTISPSKINYRANIFALKQLGAQWCVSVSAVGSLIEEFSPGSIVVPDQVIDRTNGRASTFFDQDLVAHISFADPFCPELSKILADCAGEVAEQNGFLSAEKAALICMEGPAFSTRAESLLYRSWGAQLINMTSLPEAKLAREAELPYAALALVTDYDCWRIEREQVNAAQIIATMKTNVNNATQILSKVYQKLRTAPRPEMSTNALASAFLSDPKNAPADCIERLRPLLAHYL